MREIRGKITRLEGDLEHLFGYVDSLPGSQQMAARAALRRAFDMGRSLSDLDRVPVRPPVGRDGILLLGPQLRRHIMGMRKVYGDIADLKRTIEGIFGNETLHHLHSVLRREYRDGTNTTMTELAIGE